MTEPTATRPPSRLAQALSRTSNSIAVTRTLAPAVWAGLVAFVATSFGIDLHERIAAIDGAGGVTEIHVATYAPLIMFAALYLLGKYRPGLIERLLLVVPVDRTVYAQIDPEVQHATLVNGEIDPQAILDS